MKRTDILVTMMQRLVDAGVFNGETSFYPSNMSPLKGEVKDYWIREKLTGDLEHRGTNKRTGRIYPSLIYTIAVPAGTGTALLDEKEAQIKDCFDLWAPEKCNFAGNGFAGEVTGIRIGDDYSNDVWYFRPIILNLSIHLYEGLI